ncbi:hypothetical protein EFW57_02493 [Bacillus velezensis]|nr:hypothetical protein EFW57_02493 [Bacillus velezensis]
MDHVYRRIEHIFARLYPVCEFLFILVLWEPFLFKKADR